MNTDLKHIHLNKTVLASAALATAALGAFAFIYKKKFAHPSDREHLKSGSSLPPYPDTTAMEGLENIEPGEISPKVDEPTDPANQN